MIFQRFIGAVGSLLIPLLLISHTVLASPIASVTPTTSTAASKTATTATATATATPKTTTDKPVQLVVYKSPTCGCCEEWIAHLQSHGFQPTHHHPDNLNVVKDRYKINPQYQSCHTAVSADGYVFEGHIPAQLMTRFLIEKPEGAIGLAVPGMPIGSPGMEMGERFTPYDVLLLKSDGSSEVYVRITRLKQTF